MQALLLWLRRHTLIVIVSVLVVLDGIFLSALYQRTHGVLKVSFLNVGQGDAVFIEAPNGNQLLYDAGPPTGAVLRELSKEMSFWDRSIDVAMFSHPDMDHIGGLIDVFNQYHVDLTLEPGASSTNGVWEEAEKIITAKHIGHLIARKGMIISLGDGVYADILYPDHDVTNSETNSASIVMRIRYGDTAVLVSGDLPSNLEEYEVAVYGESLHAQVLKLGHHGSRTSSSEAWLRAVAPDVAVISAGLNNRYGHPHKEVLALLEKLHIPHLVTFKEGTINFVSDGSTIVRK